MSGLSDDRVALAHEIADRLPAGFRLGAATAAYQIEGSVDDDGRGSSTWDAFAHTPGRVIDGSTGDVATDSYRRFREDIDLLAECGLDAYRFSVAWPRILPEGTLRGGVNSKGLSFYDRLTDLLLETGIDPVVTLFHWDTPLPLERAGGWLNRETARHFADYASVVADVLGDRVPLWVTVNEPVSVTLSGYALGVHAPGSRLLFDALPAAHHQLLGHGLALRALRDAGVTGQIGVANAHTPVSPATDSEPDRAMAELYDLLHNRLFADPLILGRYPEVPDAVRSVVGDALDPLAAAPPADLEAIGAGLDFYGINYYYPTAVRAGAPTSAATPDGSSDAMRQLPFSFAEARGPDGAVREKTGFGWPIAPDGLGTLLREMRNRYGDLLPAIYITESGASFPDPEPFRGRVPDGARIDYLAAHLREAASAIADGIDLRGYLVWSLLDNFEWAAGFTQRFGLVHVDFADRTRTPKDSFHWMSELAHAR